MDGVPGHDSTCYHVATDVSSVKLWGRKTFGKTDDILFHIWVNDILLINSQIRYGYILCVLLSNLFDPKQTRFTNAAALLKIHEFCLLCCSLKHTLFLKG